MEYLLTLVYIEDNLFDMDSSDDGNIDSGYSSADDKMSNLLDRDYT